MGYRALCQALTEHGVKISPSTYDEWIARQPSKRQLADEEVAQAIVQARAANKLNARLGSSKMWIKLRGDGPDVARGTTERLYPAIGWQGARYGSRHKTTRRDETHDWHPDLVDRAFAPVGPIRLWVADFAYVPTWSGMGYVAFVIDAFARRIIGSRAAHSMTTALALGAVEHALSPASTKASPT